MGDFDCTKPADGTPLLTCCQFSPTTEVACTPYRVISVSTGFSAFLNKQTCQMFAKRVETITESNPNFDPPGDRNHIITNTQRPWQALQTEYTYTTPIPARLPAVCLDRSVDSGTITDTTYDYSYDCFGTTYTVRYEYSEPIPNDLIKQKHEEIESYLVASFDYLNSRNILHLTWAWDAGGNQAVIWPALGERNRINHIICGSLSGSEQDDAAYGMFAGFYKSAGSGQFGPAGRFMKLQSDDPFVSSYGISWISWFTKGRMSREYLVKRNSIGPANTTVECQSLGPFMIIDSTSIWYKEANCVLQQSQRFSDGYNENNQPRTILFGPLDRLPHIIKISCLA